MKLTNQMRTEILDMLGVVINSKEYRYYQFLVDPKRQYLIDNLYLTETKHSMPVEEDTTLRHEYAVGKVTFKGLWFYHSQRNNQQSKSCPVKLTGKLSRF
jgi:hypothetical protein